MKLLAAFIILCAIFIVAPSAIVFAETTVHYDATPPTDTIC